MCDGAAMRVDETGELGRWSREQSSPGFAAVRRRSGAESKTFAESVPAVAEGDVEAAAKADMAGVLWKARRGEGSAGNSRGVLGFGEGSRGRR